MAFVRRSSSSWQLRSRNLPLGDRTLVMAILNITPDSFSGDGTLAEHESAIDRGLAMLDAGAAILDIGGESTRPGKREPVSAQQEIDRVLPAIQGILHAKPGAVISIDTYKAQTARIAIQSGAEIVNDVSGFLWDESMAQTCADLACGVVLTHTRGRPDEWAQLPRLSAADAMPIVRQDLEDRLRTADDAEVRRNRIVLDPGIGFGKAFDSNYPLLARLGELRQLGLPLLSGVSRKSFLARTLAQFHAGVDPAPRHRANATLAAITASILAGADIVRVHDVRPAVEAAAIADAVLAAAVAE